MLPDGHTVYCSDSFCFVSHLQTEPRGHPLNTFNFIGDVECIGEFRPQNLELCEVDIVICVTICCSGFHSLLDDSGRFGHMEDNPSPIMPTLDSTVDPPNLQIESILP